MRWLGALSALSCYVSFALPSAATKPARACIEAHAQGQEQRDAGRLISASARFQSCAVESCPVVIRKECAELGAALELQIPSIVVSVQDDAGKPLGGASATIDTTRSIPTLDTTPITLDPGLHRVEIALPDGRRQSLGVSVSAGERAKPVVASFAAKPRPQPRGSDNTLAYVIGGAGLVALGAWGAFAWDGRRKQGDLETCSPRCTDRAEIDAMRRSYLIADVLLGVSAAAIGTSAYLLITSSPDDARSARGVVVGATGRF
jgi:hypothetical protein